MPEKVCLESLGWDRVRSQREYPCGSAGQTLTLALGMAGAGGGVPRLSAFISAVPCDLCWDEDGRGGPGLASYVFHG